MITRTDAPGGARVGVGNCGAISTTGVKACEKDTASRPVLFWNSTIVPGCVWGVEASGGDTASEPVLFWDSTIVPGCVWGIEAPRMMDGRRSGCSLLAVRVVSLCL